MSPTPTIDPDAPITAVRETVINAPLERVWDIQTDVLNWPTWQAPVLSVERVDGGPLRAGSQFHWSTAVPESPVSPADVLTVTSTVHHVEHHRVLHWGGPGRGEHLQVDDGQHVWAFTDLDGTTLVHTEESWRGGTVERDIPLATEALGAALDGWLAELKSAAEQP